MKMRIVAVIIRDLKKFSRNPLVAAMSVIMPILYLIILGNSFQGKLKGLPLAVISHDGGKESRQLLDNLRALEKGPATIKFFLVKDETAALQGVRQGEYKAALVVPEDFTRRFISRNKPEVGLFLDNTDSISAETLRGVVNGALHAVQQEYVSIREPAAGTYQRDVNLYRQVDYFQSLVPGVVVMAIFLGSLTTGSFNLVMDRFLGVDESYMLTPLTRFDIVGGLIVSGLLITTGIALLIFVVSIVITGIPLVHFLRQVFFILVVIVLTTLDLMSLMFLILGRFNHPRIVGILSGFLNVILFFPSGAIYPIASFPSWLQSLAMINPEAYAVHAIKALLFKDAGLAAVSGDLVFLFMFSAVMLILSVATFKRQV
jgi:ABC-2 type transport system permease protein